MTGHYRTLRPMCPKCDHMLTIEDMNDATPDVDLWALAPNEDQAEITCPDAACGTKFHVRGGYIPEYTTALDEDDL